MNIKESLSIVRDKISELSAENLSLKNSKEELVKNNEKAIDEIFCEFLTVIDTFDRSEEAIKERGWDSEENTQKAIKRLLNAKKKALNCFNLNNKSIERLVSAVCGYKPFLFAFGLVIEQYIIKKPITYRK